MNNTTLIIAGREITQRVKSRTWQIVVTLFTVIMIAGVILANFLINQPVSLTKYGVTPAAEQVGEVLKSSIPGIEVVSVGDAEEGDKLVQSEQINTLIDIATDPTTGRITVKTTGKSAMFSELDAGVSALLQSFAGQANLAQQIAALGGDPVQIMQDSANVTVEQGYLETAAMSKDLRAYAIGMIITLILFMVIMLSGSAIAMGIGEEKGGRVVEILLASVKSTQLLWGKVLGIGIINIVQFAIPIAAALITSASLGLLDQGLALIPDLPLATIGLTSLAWFIVGYLTYTIVLAALASTASNVEDSKTAISPATIVMVIAFYAAIYFPMFLPADSIWIKIASFCPLVAPFMAPNAYAMGLIGLPELLVSLGISTLLVPVFILVSATVYKRSVLLSGTSIWSRFTKKK